MQNDPAQVITNNLEKALLTLRILRKLAVSGFYKPRTNADCMSFLKIIFDRAKTSLECRKFISFVTNSFEKKTVSTAMCKCRS